MNHTIILDNYHVSPSRLRLGTYGSYGIETIHLEISEEWKGLVLEASFSRRDQEPVTVMVDMDTLSFDVPAEAVATAGKDGLITIKGVGEGKRMFSESVAYIVTEHGETSGNTAVPPTPTEVEQILQIANQAKENAKVAVTAAENADAAAVAANTAAENANCVADALTAEKNAGAFNGADGYTPVKGVDYGTPKEIEEISRQAADVIAPEVNQIKDDFAAEQTARETADNALRADLTANANADVAVKRSLDALWKLNQGISYQFEQDNTESYQKTVPTGAKLASVEAFGGRTEVIDAALVSTDTSCLSITGKNVFIDNPSKLIGYGGGYCGFEIGGLIPLSAYTVSVSNTDYVRVYGYIAGYNGQEFIGHKTNNALSIKAGKKVTVTSREDGSLSFSVNITGFSSVDDFMLQVKNAWHDLQIEIGDTATNYSPYHKTEIPIPDAIRAMPGYGWSAGDVTNTIERTESGWQYVQRVGSRDYQDGDIVTDGVTSCYVLDAPVITDITDMMADFAEPFEVEVGGTITLENTAHLSVPNSVEYIVSLAEVNG